MAIRNTSAGKDVMKKLRVAVLTGGPSAEHEVSLNTGKMIFRNLDANKYSARLVEIGHDGFWPISRDELKNDFDLVFNAMHGEYGEDGTIQKILDDIGVPYTGSGMEASKLGMDKEAFYNLMRRSGIIYPPFSIDYNEKGLRYLGLPLVVKPTDRGSSVGVSIVQNWNDLTEAVKLARKYSPKTIFQKYIKGHELTCGVLEIEDRATPLPPTEIIPVNSPFFDYKAKYSAGASQEITPPNLPEEQIEKIKKTSLKVYQLTGCKNYSRVDFILGENDKLYVLEINTLPGMTETSLLPQEAKAAGINFPQLLDIIIKSSLS